MSKNKNKTQDVKKQVFNHYENSIQRFDDSVKHILVKELFEYIGEFTPELFFILELEFQPYLDKSTKKFKLTHFSTNSEKENPEKSFKDFLKILENYKNPNKPETEVFFNELTKIFVELEKVQIIRFL